MNEFLEKRDVGSTGMQTVRLGISSCGRQLGDVGRQSGSVPSVSTDRYAS